MMSGAAREVLLGIGTVAEMIEAFRDEERCRRLLEAMVWPNGRVCPACGYKRSIALAGRDMGRYRARPGLYQCSNGACCFQFTATTRTPLHATKLPLSTWLKALWLILQSDKGLSSIRLAEALGVSQPTAWRIGHALRLMLARENPLGGTVEIDEFYLGGRPKKRRNEPPPGRGRKGLRKTTKSPALVVVQRPGATIKGAPAGDARASVVANLSMDEVERVLEKEVEPEAHLMSDEWKAFIAVGQNFAMHETVQHARREYVRGAVHANSAEGFNLRVQRTVAGVFHHISPQHADFYFHEIGFRWSQRVVTGEVIRRTRRGREKVRTLWSRVPPALQLLQVFRAAIGRQMRRTSSGGIAIKSTVAVFSL
jgi:ISXO2 transposase-like protein/transposase-like zinc ribbon protein